MPPTRRTKLRRVAKVALVVAAVLLAVSAVSFWKTVTYTNRTIYGFLMNGRFLVWVSDGQFKRKGVEIDDTTSIAHPFQQMTVADLFRLPEITRHDYPEVTTVVISLGLPTILLGAFGVLTLWLTRKRPGPGHCVQCGYDLRSSPGRCPECGAATGADV